MNFDEYLLERVNAEIDLEKGINAFSRMFGVDRESRVVFPFRKSWEFGMHGVEYPKF